MKKAMDFFSILRRILRILVCGGAPEDQETKPKRSSRKKGSSVIPHSDAAGPSNYAEAVSSSIPDSAPAPPSESGLVGVAAVTGVLRRSREEIAAVRIETAFRGYMAKRKLRALKGLVRLRSLLNGRGVRHQVTSALSSMLMPARAQLQIHARRAEMQVERRAAQFQSHLQMKSDHEMKTFERDKDWDLSHRSKEEVEASLKVKEEASRRRVRTLAYAYAHQWKNPSKRVVIPAFSDPGTLQWRWSWIEQWVELKAWESPSTPAPTTSHPPIRCMSSDPPSMGSRMGAGAKSSLPSKSVPQEFSRRHSVSETSAKDVVADVAGMPKQLRHYLQGTAASRAWARARSPSAVRASVRRHSDPAILQAHGDVLH